jgi:Holliday junction DNA helicase RuvB
MDHVLLFRASRPRQDNAGRHHRQRDGRATSRSRPAPPLRKPGEMAAILNGLQEGDVLFVDEIHRLNKQVEEVLYPAMEDYAIDIMIGKGCLRQIHPAGAAEIHADRRDHTRGTAVRAAARPLRHHPPAGILFGRDSFRRIILRSADVLGVTARRRRRSRDGQAAAAGPRAWRTVY